MANLFINDWPHLKKNRSLLTIVCSPLSNVLSPFTRNSLYLKKECSLFIMDLLFLIKGCFLFTKDLFSLIKEGSLFTRDLFFLKTLLMHE